MTSDTNRHRRGADLERIPRSAPHRVSQRHAHHRWNLRLASVATRIPVATLVQSPTLLVVAVEDVCWQSAVEWTRARRPRRWHRAAYRAWLEQLQRLDDKRGRLQELAKDELRRQ
jgi:hypothetical protein